MDNCLLVFSEEKHCAAAPGKQDSLVFPVGEKTMKRRIGPACLSFLSKRAGPPGRKLITGLACFFGGRKDNGPTALPGGLACLFYLKESLPLELPASPIGGGEKTACLSFLSKRAAQLPREVLDQAQKNPRHFCRGFLVGG
mgnify:CR=1 FL=1